jgi:tRNA G10  N-methylase Trm11
LVTNDLDPTTDADFHQDFRQMSWPDGSFDAIAYDPPYVCAGGRTTTGIAEFHDRFGMDDAPRRAEDLQVLINDGLTEMARLARAGGVILVKCKDYISSGRLFEGTYLTRKHAEGLGLKCEDRLEYIGNQSPQSQARQLHARRNLSTLFVFKKAAAHA